MKATHFIDGDAFAADLRLLVVVLGQHSFDYTCASHDLCNVHVRN